MQIFHRLPREKEKNISSLVAYKNKEEKTYGKTDL